MLDPMKESPPEQEESGGEARETMEAPEERSGGSSRRVLLLALLLLVAAGAGFHFYFGGAEGPGDFSPPVRAAVSGQPITMPVPAPPTAAERSGDASVGEDVPAAPVAPSEPPVETAPPKAAAEVKAAPVEAPPVKVPKAVFALQTGPFLLPSERLQAERTLRTLGFEPAGETVEQTVTLTRLRLGVYPSAEALPRLREAQALIPGAFPLRQGDDLAIYAGSFHDIDRARIYADELYEKKISVEEEEAQVSLEVDVLRFGAFEGEDQAVKAMEAARGAGLESRLVRLP